MYEFKISARKLLPLVIGGVTALGYPTASSKRYLPLVIGGVTSLQLFSV